MAKSRARQPLNAVESEARSQAKLNAPAALDLAIRSLSAETLRTELLYLCCEFPAITHTLKSRILVQGKDVVRYHVDPDSENQTESDEESDVESDKSESESASESDGSDESKLDRNVQKRYPIVIGDEEYTSRISMCNNCNQEFDVTMNARGDCVWHPGMKDVYEDDDFWADHDVNCHGPYESFEDDTDFADGFRWDCCDNTGNHEGCKSTKHSAKVNVVVPAKTSAPLLSKKRKVDEEAPANNFKKGRC